MTDPNADDETAHDSKRLPPPPFVGRHDPTVEPEPQIPGLETDPDL